MATNNVTNTPELIANGQLMIGSSGNNPVASILTPGPGISIVEGPGTITISATAAGNWVDQTTTPVNPMELDTGYTSNGGATTIEYHLPAVAATGDSLEINGKGTGLFNIKLSTGQVIHFGSLTTSPVVGVGIGIASTSTFDCIRLRCIDGFAAVWTVVFSVGNFAIF